MKAIEFNLDTYKRIVSGELEGSVQTRRGTKVYVQRTDGKGGCPVIVQPEGSAVFYTYTIDGRIRSNIDNEDDLVIILKDKVMETKLVKVLFDVDLAKRIQNGECEGKIVTCEGDSVRILCWDKKDKTYPLVALVDDGSEENFKSYTNEGKWNTDKTSTLKKYDLMLEIPEYMTFKDGDVIAFGVIDTFIGIFKSVGYRVDAHSDYVVLTHENELRFDGNAWTFINSRKATEEEKQKLIDALKASKEPKAKECLKIIGIEQKQEYEFKPFDRVLVRDSDDDIWDADIFSRQGQYGSYICIGGLKEYCIPYNEQTAHLLGTTDNWDE